MRLLFITNDFPNPLDPTKAVFNLHLVKALSREHQVQVISPISWVDELAARGAGGARVPSDRKAVIDGVAVHYPRYYYSPKILRGLYGWFYWQSIRGVARSLIRSFSPEAVLSYWVHPDGQAAIRAGRLADAKSAVIVGGSDVQLITQDPARYQRVQKVLQNIDAVITVSQDLKQKVEQFDVDAGKVHVWAQGIDPSIFFPADKSAAKQKLGSARTGLQLLWVGRMVPVKGLEILLQACALLRQRQFDFHLNLVGDGPLRQSIEAEVARLGLTSAITFCGPVQPHGLGDYYRAADLFVMSSWSEGLPNVLRESLACGTPFVASRVGGIAEIAGQANRLFPAGDSTAMADAILAMAASAGSSPNQPPPTWDQSARDIIRIIESIPVRKGAPAEAGPAWSPRQIMRTALAAALPPSLLITHGPRQSKAVCLTFDDGPHPEHTPRILDVLRAHSIKATFFVLGERAEEHPQLIKRIVMEGHTLAQHSYSHANSKNASARELIESVRHAGDVLSELTSTKTNLFRPPYGKLTAARLWALWREKQTIVLWNRDPKDFARTSADELRAWLAARPLAGGDIVLLHDVFAHTAEALPDFIRAARDANLEFTTVDRWLHETDEAEQEEAVASA